MFSFKLVTGGVLLFNLKYVLYVKPSLDTGNIDVMMVDKTIITLIHNWEKRDDVARFKKAMSEYSGVQWDDN